MRLYIIETLCKLRAWRHSSMLVVTGAEDSSRPHTNEIFVTSHQVSCFHFLNHRPRQISRVRQHFDIKHRRLGDIRCDSYLCENKSPHRPNDCKLLSQLIQRREIWRPRRQSFILFFPKTDSWKKCFISCLVINSCAKEPRGKAKS